MGGDSLNAIRIIACIKNEFHVKIYIKDIMYNPKIYEISNYIDSLLKRNDKYSNNELIKTYNCDEYPISCILSNINIDINQLRNNGEIDYEKFKISKSNIILYYRIKSTINLEKLTKSFNTLINRHKILKTKFIIKKVNGKNEMFGKIIHDAKIEIEHYTKDNFMELEKQIDITKDSLIRVALIENDILMIKISHYISDGYSYGILINELFKLYNDEVLEDLPIQYSDFACHYDKKINSEDYTEQIEYYSSLFNVPYSNMILSTLYNNNNSENKFIHKYLTIKTDTEVYNNVNRIIKENNISKTVLFLSIYGIVMSAYSGHDNIFVDMFNSNRTNTYTDKLIGYFVKFTPVLVKMEDINLIDFLIKYKNILLTLFSYDVPYTIISDKLNLKEGGTVQ